MYLRSLLASTRADPALCARMRQHVRVAHVKAAELSSGRVSTNTCKPLEAKSRRISEALHVPELIH